MVEEERGGWKFVAARDIVAVGGIPFFILILVRVYLLNNPIYFSQFVIAGILFLGSFFLFKQNIYAGLGLIVLIFTSLYYDDLVFSVFGIVAYVFLLAGLFYLKKDVKKIFFGIILGALGIGISYLILGLA